MSSSSTPNIEFKQDRAPAGGYPTIEYSRKLPRRGPPGWALFGVTTAISMFGFYLVGVRNRRKSTWLAEKREARKVILPILQAEEDLRWLRSQTKPRPDVSTTAWMPPPTRPGHD